MECVLPPREASTITERKVPTAQQTWQHPRCAMQGRGNHCNHNSNSREARKVVGGWHTTQTAWQCASLHTNTDMDTVPQVVCDREYAHLIRASTRMCTHDTDRRTGKTKTSILERLKLSSERRLRLRFPRALNKLENLTGFCLERAPRSWKRKHGAQPTITHVPPPAHTHTQLSLPPP